MSIGAQDLLAAAHSMCGSDLEALHRSATSRAYYAVYHGCLEWEKSFPGVGSSGGPEGGSHQQLINRLRNPAPELRDPQKRSLSKIVAARVEALKIKRHAADYQLVNPSHSQADALNSCAQAQEILQKVGLQEQVVQTPPTVPVTASSCETAPEVEPDPPTPAPTPFGSRPSLRRVR